MNDNGNGNPDPDPATAAPHAYAPPSSAPRTAKPLARVPLGEELPIFCERCGYSLSGLPQIRCDHCRVLHFSCPECDHHQPINTLRPAALRALGRLRALGLALIVFLKVNFFFWCLFIWGVIGLANAYSYVYYGPTRGGSLGATRYEWEVGLGIFLYGLGFGLVGRLLLLRWRMGILVGLAMAAFVMLAMAIGGEIRRLDYSSEALPSPIAGGMLMYMGWAFLSVCVGATVAWGVWLSLVMAFLPKRAATALLEWQRAMSAPKGAPDRTDVTTSVTA